MLSQSRAITYRYQNNKYKYISQFKCKHQTHNLQQQQITKPPAYNLSINPREAKDLSQIIQYIDTVKNNLDFINAILLQMKDDVNLNKLQQRQLNIALQQTNTILKHHGKNNEKENKAIASFRHKYNHTQYMELQIQQRQFIIQVITILGLPNRLNQKMYGYNSQHELYQQILRIILLLDIYKRKQCLETLSEARLMDIALRIMKGKISSSVNFKGNIINAIINKIPEFTNNYKYYKKNQQFDKEQEEGFTEFKKEELFVNWINIAEQENGLDVPLFEILFEYFSDANEMTFVIDTFGYKIVVNLYNKMSDIMMKNFF